MAELPLGCKFLPTDEEIFTYLDNKVNDLQQQNVKLDLVKQLDLYQSCPSDHQGLSKQECTYIFTTRVARYGTSEISYRKTEDGKGCWKGSAPPKGFNRGTKRTLTYYQNSKHKRGRKEKRTDWIMHEYALKPADPKMKVNETEVMCRIINKKPKHEVTDAKQEAGSSPKDGTGGDKSGVKSSEENQQNTLDLSLRLQTG